MPHNLSMQCVLLTELYEIRMTFFKPLLMCSMFALHGKFCVTASNALQKFVTQTEYVYIYIFSALTCIVSLASGRLCSM